MSDSNKRKIEIIADEQFEGNITLAIRHIFDNRQMYDCDEYYSEFTTLEKNFVDNILYDLAVKEYGKKTVNADSLGSLRRIKHQILPKAYEQDIILTKEKVLKDIVFHKTQTADYIMKFGIFITIFTYIFAVPISFLTENFLILIYPVPVIVVLFIIFYIIKIWNKKSIIKEKEKGFNLIKATCTSVKRNPEYGESDISSNEVYFNGYIRYTDYNLDARLKEGVSCYLAMVDGEVKSVFFADECKLDAELNNMLK